MVNHGFSYCDFMVDTWQNKYFGMPALLFLPIFSVGTHPCIIDNADPKNCTLFIMYNWYRIAGIVMKYPVKYSTTITY